MPYSIEESLNLFVGKGNVCEIRCLGVEGKKRTDTGYFTDFAMAQKAVEPYIKDKTTEAVYFVLNKFNPDLFARAANRMKPYLDTTVSDKDVIERRWLFIDVDPKKAAKISSTDSQVQAALERANRIADWLMDFGFPDPVAAMSGNGAHLHFPIWLPNDHASNDLIKHVIKAVSQHFSDDEMDIDEKVFNAGRICKLYGTFARKGDSTADRPHRKGVLSYVPDYLADGWKQSEVCSLDALRKVAELYVEEKPPVRPQGFSGTSLIIDAEKFLYEKGFTFKVKAGAKGWTKYLLSECPFDDSHKSPDSYVGQHESGAMTFFCSHNSCSGNRWQQFKDKHGDPYKEQRQQQPEPNVNISRLIEPSIHRDPELKPIHVPDRVVLNPEFCEPPGVIGDLVRYMRKTAKFAHDELFLGASLSLLSVITGRKVMDCDNMRTNLYTVGVAPTGAGKEHARVILKKVLNHPQANASLLGDDNFSSGPAVVNMVSETPACISVIDEIGIMLEAACKENASQHLKDITFEWMKMFTSSGDGQYRPKAYANRENRKTINQPHFVLYGTTTKTRLWKGLSPENVADGFIGRFLVFYSSGPKGYAKYNKEARPLPIPESIIDHVSRWCSFKAGDGDLADMNPDPILMNYTGEAWQRLQDHCIAVFDKRDGEDEINSAIWSRATEKTVKLSMLAACSRQEPSKELTIEIQDVEWAVKIVNFLTRRLIREISGNIAENDHERDLQRILRIVANEGGIISHRKLGQRVRWITSRDRGMRIAHLVEAEELFTGVKETSGRYSIVYALNRELFDENGFTDYEEYKKRMIDEGKEDD